jgi:hypothetical protein
MLSHVSGKAHEMIQKRIDGQAFIYMSNFAKSVQRAGEVWLSMAKEVYVEKGRKMKTVDNTGQMGTVELLKEGLNKSGQPTEKNDLTKATFDVSVDVGPSSASQREATVSTITGMLAITQDPQDAKVLQNLAMMNMEGDGISDVRDYYRKNLVRMGVIKPTEEEAEMLAEEAKNAKPDPNAQALEAMAAEAIAKAKKTEAEIQEVASEVQLNMANIDKIYADIKVDKADSIKKFFTNKPNVG